MHAIPALEATGCVARPQARRESWLNSNLSAASPLYAHCDYRSKETCRLPARNSCLWAMSESSPRTDAVRAH
jgi:hypothetical protein